MFYKVFKIAKNYICTIFSYQNSIYILWSFINHKSRIFMIITCSNYPPPDILCPLKQFILEYNSFVIGWCDGCFISKLSYPLKYIWLFLNLYQSNTNSDEYIIYIYIKLYYQIFEKVFDLMRSANIVFIHYKPNCWISTMIVRSYQFLF